MDAPLPQNYDRIDPSKMLAPQEEVRTVRNYGKEVAEDLGIDDLLDFGFGDIE